MMRRFLQCKHVAIRNEPGNDDLTSGGRYGGPSEDRELLGIKTLRG
ncbi:MAG: hypothetical protein HOI86_12500 [Tateyamaria sp.]|jgi:hypothetical protein|nr:hypothetical protein [Tateyamaria sp.]MBT5302142.1 hypothetical protein [Tateyamaria sp.]MBT6268482.1 hypothetical protein [Tateyamaria sp.]MBT6344595.1 hypothetical protein [Tateyamaria sp.]MBT7449050.1 hypothetical protein [Tateyamaria sp.]